eukprot:4775072-Alexandrium_andersonii.AAC.2
MLAPLKPSAIERLHANSLRRTNVAKNEPLHRPESRNNGARMSSSRALAVGSGPVEEQWRENEFVESPCCRVGP